MRFRVVLITFLAPMECLLFWGLMLISVSTLRAAPFAKVFQCTQSDGSVVEVRGEGDEFYAVFETLDGYTAVFDDSQLSYCYAQRANTDDGLVSTGKPIHRFTGEQLRLEKHLRAGSQAIRKQVSAQRLSWESRMQLRYRLLAPQPARIQKMGVEAGGTVSNIGLCLLVDFDDDPAAIPQADVLEFCNGTNYTGYGNNGSVREYFQYNSNGKLDYRNVITAYIRIPNSVHPKSWYDDPAKGAGEQGNYLIRDALDILKALPNYQSEILPALADLTTDDQTNIVACNVFYAGKNRGAWGRGLWAHSYALAIVGPQELWPGGPTINRYQISEIGSELSLGTFCHENGHLICGFPDIYDYNYDSVGGAGRFCAMNSGSRPKNPVQFCAFLKMKAGWETVTDLLATPAGTLTLQAQWGPEFNHFYRLNKTGSDSEYFLLECRNKSGHDAEIPGSGVAVWHIDENGNRDNQNLEYNTIHSNYQVSLVPADGLWDFQRNQNDGDDRDLFHLGNAAAGYLNAFTDLSIPPARWWDGIGSHLVLANFSGPALAMTVDFHIEGVPTDEVPFIVYQPNGGLLVPGTNLTLTATVLGAQPITYQWFKDSAPLSDQTGSTLNLANVGLENLGQYFLVASNHMGLATSHIARISLGLEQSRITFGGYAYVAAKSNNLVFVTASDGSLNIVDLNDSTRPRRTARYRTVQPTIGIALSGKYAYVGSRDDGLLVFDVSDPFDPWLVSNVYTGGDARGVVVRDSYAYVADINAGLIVFDLTDPVRPRKVGQCRATATKAERITIQGRYVYLACQEGGLQIVDVSNPDNPVFMGGYAMDTSREADKITVGVTVVGNTVFTAENQGGFKIIDVSNPAMPTLLGKGSTRFAKHVAVSGSIAMVGDYIEGLVVFDVSDLRNPRRIGTFPIDGNSETVFTDGDLIHMVNGYGGLLTMKILSQPDQQVLKWRQQPASRVISAGTSLVLSAQAIGARPISYQWLHDGVPIAGASAETLSLSNVQAGQAGEYACVASTVSGSITSRPAKVVVITAQGSMTFGDSARAVAVRDHYAYVAAGQDGLKVVDISDPAHLEVVGTGKGNEDYLMQRITVWDHYAYISEFMGKLLVFDIHDPRNPVFLDYHCKGTKDIAIGNNGAVLLQDTRIVPASLSSPNAPRPVSDGIQRSLGLWDRVEIKGDLVLAGEGDSKCLRLYGLSDSDQLWTIGSLQTETPCAIAIGDGYAVSPSWSDGLLICDLGNPRLPLWMSQVSLEGGLETRGVALQQGLAVVAQDSLDFLLVYDVRDPQMPVLADKVPKPNGSGESVGGTSVIAWEGDKICMANTKAGLFVLQVATRDNRPRITREPESQRYHPGDRVELSVQVESTEPAACQWYFNNVPLPGATNVSLVLDNASVVHHGYYRVGAQNRWGSTLSQPARLDPMIAPQIVSPPIGGTVEASTRFQMRVVAAGLPPLNYQWFKDGTPIFEGANDTFTIDSVARNQAGIYSVWVSNEYGATNSPAIELAVANNALERIWQFQTFAPWAYGFKTTADFVFMAACNVANARGGVGFGEGSPIFDLRDLAKPKRIGTLPADACGIDVAVNLAVLACADQGLVLYDVANPSHPASVSSFKTVADAMDVAVAMPYAYVAVGNAGVQVVNLSDPNNPVAAATCDTPGNARKLVVSGQCLYVADREVGLQILDISNPIQPRIVGSYQTGAYSVGITVVGNLAYLTDDPGGLGSPLPSGLRILDITEPSKPKLLSYYRTSFAKTVAVAGQYAFVADYVSGLLMLDVSDPKNPMLLRRLSQDLLHTEGVGIFGNQVCVADGSGLTVYDANMAGMVPAIIDAPENLSVPLGANTHWGANVAGPEPIGYQWYYNGSPLPAATNRILNLSPTRLSDTGSYILEAYNVYGTNRSRPAVLTVTESLVVSVPAQDQVRYAGNTLQLQVAAHGQGPFEYQWYFNGVALSNDSRIIGAQGPELRVAGVVTNDSGNYSVLVRRASDVLSNQVARIWIPGVGQLAWKLTLPKGNYSPKLAVDSFGALYIGAGRDCLQAIDGRSGAVLWSFLSPMVESIYARIGNISTAPVLDDQGTVYVSLNDNYLYALDTLTGSEKWRFRLRDYLVGSPALDPMRQRLYFVTRTGFMGALDLTTQRLLWSRLFTGLSGDDCASPVVGSDGTVYVSSRNNTMYAFHPNSGRELWKSTLGFSLFPSILPDDTLFAAAQAFDGRTGQSKLRNLGNPVAIGNPDVLYTLSDIVQAHNAHTGALIWKRNASELDASGREDGGALAVGSDEVIYFDWNQTLFACDGRTGAKLWSYLADTGFGQMIPCFGPEGLIYFTTQSGTLYAVQTTSDGPAASDWPCGRRNASNQACLPQKTVIDVPIVGEAQSLAINEDSALPIKLRGSDIAGLPLTYSVSSQPQHGTLSGVAPNLTYVPNRDYAGEDRFAFVVNNGEFNSVPAEVTIHVQPVNDAPVLAPVNNQTVMEGTLLRLAVTASDVDQPPQILTYSLDPGAPQGAAIDALSGVFEWTPTASQSPSTNRISILATDNGTPPLTDVKSFQVVVVPVIPSYDPIVSAGLLAWFPFDGNAHDYGSQGYHGILCGAIPAPDRFGFADRAYQVSAGKCIKLPSFSWPSPTNFSVALWTKTDWNTSGFQHILTKSNRGGTAEILVRTLDGKFMCHVNTASGGKDVLSSTRSPIDGFDFIVLTYDGSNLRLYVNTNLAGTAPCSEAIKTNNEPIWLSAAPDEPFAGRAIVDDLKFYARVLTLKEMRQLYVGSNPDNNHPPVLASIGDRTIGEGTTLRFAATATDPDVPAWALAFSLGENTPRGATITRDGQFTWTPVPAQAPGVHAITIRVSDGWTIAQETIRVTVDGPVSPPDPLIPQGLVAWYPFEGNANDFGSNRNHGSIKGAAAASGFYGLPNTAFSVSRGKYIEIPARAYPSSANFSVALWVKPQLKTTGLFNLLSKSDTGTPAQLLLRVSGGNYSCQVDTTRTSEYISTSVPPSASQFDFLVVTYDGTNVRFYVNASLAGTRWFTIPIATNAVPVRLSGNPNDILAATAVIDDLKFYNRVLSSNEIDRLYAGPILPKNNPPILANIPVQIVEEGNLLSFNAQATDSDVPAQQLTFNIAGTSMGASITSEGQFSWTPIEEQGPSTNFIRIWVSDGITTVSTNVTVIVTEVNTPPLLIPIGDKSVNAGELLSFTVLATDNDSPRQTLAFSLESAPAGASIDPVSGLFTWTPSGVQGPSTNQIVVKVTDNGVPPLTDTESPTIVVKSTSAIAPLRLETPFWRTNGIFQFTVRGSTGQKYVIQSSSNLVDWLNWKTNILPGPSADVSEEPPAGRQRRFYRTQGMPE